MQKVPMMKYGKKQENEIYLEWYYKKQNHFNSARYWIRRYSETYNSDQKLNSLFDINQPVSNKETESTILLDKTV